jgi:hypothetical protein
MRNIYQKVEMKYLGLLTIFLAVFSCSNLNQVETDGGRSLNGKVVDILYAETDKEVNKIETKLIQEFGRPKITTAKELTWELSSGNLVNDGPVVMTVRFDSLFHLEGKTIHFDNVKFYVCFTDIQGNDLLADKKMKIKGQRIFQKIFNEIE